MGSNIASDDEQIALSKLIVNNPDLEKLESLLSEFNLFEAVGMVRQELQHSNLLAFLLTPSERHGLGDRFLKKLLISAFSESPVFSSIEIDIADLTDVEVRREWRNIDLLIYSQSNGWAIAIENKVDSKERSGQLRRYQRTVVREFPFCLKKAFIYLTKEGEAASRKQWQSLSYGKIANMLEAIQNKHHSSLSSDVQTLIFHYISLIRRHFVSDSEIAQLCRKIYKQHYPALDLIYAHRPDMQLQVSDFLQEMIKGTTSAGIELDDSNKWWVRFALKQWDEKMPVIQKSCDRWTSSRRLVLFEFFINKSTMLDLNLVIGPGNKADKEAIFDPVKALDLPNTINSKLVEGSWSVINSRRILSKPDYAENNWESIQNKISHAWKKYVEYELTAIAQAVSKMNDAALIDVSHLLPDGSNLN
ncbi:MAG: PD-(D/E)XK nuclease family protein [Phormidesmis sp.]